ncbi:thioredoxin-like protein YneN [Salinimicrobium marinum]|uniref:Thioredoxin-like protein YneN n=1 Tax=Salinimicrobium marinum TaxID=680283 RepID=A0A918S8Q3_9FLAO|nr:TlpA disulfide reductase family protein [Salinimicrobium marinum]GHA29306.1 thioredoxin-like protein YneN [Salinimicrobium marinum]
MKFLKSHWSNIVFLLIILLLIIPQTRKPLQVGLNRLISFSPSEVSEENRNTLFDYNWQLKKIDGNPVNFKEAKGEVVILNLWATWCPPCIAEMPSFQSLYDDYGDRVNFYFVSAEEADKLEKFLEKKEYTFPVLQPSSSIPELLDSNSLPTTYVLSRKGEIVIEKTGAADWNSSSFRKLLDELLAEQP